MPIGDGVYWGDISGSSPLATRAVRMAMQAQAAHIGRLGVGLNIGCSGQPPGARVASTKGVLVALGPVATASPLEPLKVPLLKCVGGDDGLVTGGVGVDGAHLHSELATDVFVGLLVGKDRVGPERGARNRGPLSLAARRRVNL